MNKTTDNHLVYKVKDSDLYIAVSRQYLRDIRLFAREYQGLDAVPADRVIKGILFKVEHEHLSELKDRCVEVILTVNQLAFDTGNLRLSA